MTDRELLEDARRWIEQEQVWDDQLYVGGKSASPASSDKSAALSALYERYKDCARCSLAQTRIKFVFGVGNPDAEVLFIGEGPGYEEDRRGEPFVGKAGQLLDKIMAAIGLDRKNSYIANIVKCHPMLHPETPEARGNDRPPSVLEVEACLPILRQQIAIIQPRVIVTLGSPSTRTLLQTTDGITKVRGRLFPLAVDSFYPAVADGSLFDRPDTPPDALEPAQRTALSRTQILPTYHPAALLRNPDLKRDVWTDMKLLRQTLGAQGGQK